MGYIRKNTAKNKIPIKIKNPERLKARLDKWIMFEPNTGCWLWAGSLQFGYGQVRLNKKSIRAHRVSYQLHKGEIGEKLVCHTCDVRCCVNPDHLFLGTYEDNNRDKIAKGRTNYVIGDKCSYAILKSEDVLKIRELHESGINQRILAKQFNVHFATINLVVNRKNWKHI